MSYIILYIYQTRWYSREPWMVLPTSLDVHICLTIFKVFNSGQPSKLYSKPQAVKAISQTKYGFNLTGPPHQGGYHKTYSTFGYNLGIVPKTPPSWFGQCWKFSWKEIVKKHWIWYHNYQSAFYTSLTLICHQNIIDI